MGKGLIIAGVFLISLFLSSFIISYFAIGFYNDHSVTVIDLPFSETGFTYSDNLKTSCNLSAYEVTGSWSCDANGLTLSGDGGLRVPLNLKSQDGIYSNSYTIVNPQGSYALIVTDTHYGQYIYLRVSNDGIRIPSVFSLLPFPFPRYETGTAHYIPIQGLLKNETVIKTLYNINTNGLTVTVDDVSYIVPPMEIPASYLAPAEVVYTQGVLDAHGLSITSLASTFSPVITEGAGMIDGLARMINLAYAMARLATYSFPYHILPLEVQLLIIAPQEFMIIIGVATFIREG
jgi:hypothetical protein